MAKNKRNRVYKLTPRRQAALHKAQLASARKRRGRGVAIAGVVGATIVAGGTVYAGHRYVKGLKGGPTKPNVVSVTVSSHPPISRTATLGIPTVPKKEIKLSTSKELDLVRIAPTPKLKKWSNVGKPARARVVKPVKHKEHDRLYNARRKARERQDRKNLLKRRYYRKKQQALGKWRTR